MTIPPLVVSIFAMSATGEAIVDLLFGWYSFLDRVLPLVTYDPSALVVAGAALILFTVGSHLVARKITHGANGETSQRWRWRTTFATVAGLFVLFAAGISLVGITHQGMWLYTADEPLRIEAYEPWRRGLVENNMKQIGLAVHNYHDVWEALPSSEHPFNASGEAMHSWQSRILVFVGSAYDTRNIHWDLPWRDPRHRAVFQSVIDPYINPRIRIAPGRNRQGYGLSHFAGNSRVTGPAPIGTLADITDGTANTILFGEVNTGFRPWGDPVNWRDPSEGIASTGRTFSGPESEGNTTFCMADGSAKSVNNKIDPDVLKALATPK